MQQNLGLLEQQTSLLIAMEFLCLRPANFFSNCNVALHTRSLGPPWFKIKIEKIPIIPVWNFRWKRRSIQNLQVSPCWLNIYWPMKSTSLFKGKTVQRSLQTGFRGVTVWTRMIDFMSGMSAYSRNGTKRHVTDISKHWKHRVNWGFCGGCCCGSSNGIPVSENPCWSH